MSTVIERTDTNWIMTQSGRQFWPLNPRPQDVWIDDIAHALANKCRWTGHTKQFYSVAQHAVLVSLHCTENPQWGLMHDAGEAYLPDVARPVKNELTGFRDIEDQLLGVISRVYGLQMPIPECVHQSDVVLLATERQQLMCNNRLQLAERDQAESWDYRINPWEPELAKRAFLNRFEELFA